MPLLSVSREPTPERKRAARAPTPQPNNAGGETAGAQCPGL